MALPNAAPEITVVMPLFDKAKTVRRAVDSARAQTVGSIELIVVNDGSTDDGPAIIRTIEDPRVRLLDQANCGVSAARNRGIAEARTDLIAFLDADDEWEPDFLETILALRRSYVNCEVFATSYWICTSAGRQLAVLRGLPLGFESGILPDYFAVAAVSHPPLWTSAVAVSRRALDAVGGFPVGITAGEDLLTWARLAARFDVAFTVLPKARFWMPVGLSDRPGRLPQFPDRVAQGMLELVDTGSPSKTLHLARYRAHWHQMRATIFGVIGDGASSRREATSAWRLDPTPKSALLYLAGFLPRHTRAHALELARRAKRALVP